TAEFQHHTRQLRHTDLVGVAEVDRADDAVIGGHHPHETLDQVVDVTERPRLRAVTVDGDRLPSKGLYDEIAHHPTVVRVHTWTVRVEDAHDLDAHVALPVVVEE